jgi:hypothetical protein
MLALLARAAWAGCLGLDSEIWDRTNPSYGLIPENAEGPGIDVAPTWWLF